MITNSLAHEFLQNHQTKQQARNKSWPAFTSFGNLAAFGSATDLGFERGVGDLHRSSRCEAADQQTQGEYGQQAFFHKWVLLERDRKGYI
jgi:hypothetical protein